MVIKISTLFLVVFITLGTIFGQPTNQLSKGLNNKTVEQQAQQLAKKHLEWKKLEEKKHQQKLNEMRELLRKRTGVSRKKKEELRIRYFNRVTQEQKSWKNKYKKNIVQLLKKRFGEKIDFSGNKRRYNSGDLFWKRVRSVSAYPFDDFHEMPEQIKRSKELQTESDHWFKVFFNKKFRPHTAPSKYYLKTDVWPSTLYYSWNVEEYQFSMFETKNGVLIEISLKDGKPIRPTPKEFEVLFKKIVNTRPVKKHELSEEILTVPPFRLSRNIKEGDIFTNAGTSFIEETKDGWREVKNQNTQEANSIHSFFGGHSWRDNIVAFASQKGLCITLTKSDKYSPQQENPWPSYPQLDWFSKGLVFPSVNK